MPTRYEVYGETTQMQHCQWNKRECGELPTQFESQLTLGLTPSLLGPPALLKRAFSPSGVGASQDKGMMQDHPSSLAQA